VVLERINDMNYLTGRKLSDGTEIQLGDKLKGSQSSEVVVLLDLKTNNHIVEVIENTNYWFPLDNFLNSWGSSVIKTGSILERKF
jgi:hypothetical protein